MTEEKKKIISSARAVREFASLMSSSPAPVEKSGGWFFDEQGAGGGYSDNGIWDREVKALIDAYTLKSLFFNEDWPYIVVDLVAQKISNQRLLVVEKKRTPQGVVYTPDPGHPVQSRLDHPNDREDYHSFMYNHACDHTLMGNALVWDQRKRQRLINLPAERVCVKFDARPGEISAYSVMDLIESDGMTSSKTNQNMKPEEIIHTMRPNPSSMFWGLSPFIPGRKSVLFNRYSIEYLTKFFSSPTPGLALKVDKDANERVALRMLRSFEMAYYGRKNQRRTMILPKGVSAENINASLGDVQLREYVEQNRETIMNLLKVPKHELSLQGTGSLGSEEARMALRNFWSATLIPTMRRIAGGFTRHFADLLGDSREIIFDIADVEVLQDDRLKRAKLGEAMLKTHTVNEVRRELYDKPPIDGGDRLSDDPGPPVLPTRDPNSSDRVAREEDKPESSALVNMSYSREEIREYMKRHPDWSARKNKAEAEGVTSLEMQMEKLAEALLVRFADATLKVLAPDEKDLSDADKNRIRRDLGSEYETLEAEWLKEITPILKKALELGYDDALDVPFEITPAQQDEIAALRDRQSGQRTRVLKLRTQGAFADMSDTTVEKVMSRIERGLEAGESIPEVARDLVKNVLVSQSRANTIARTETLTAKSLGEAAAIANAAEVIPGLKKMWFNANDDRVRDSHLDVKAGGVSGEVVNANELFSNGLGFPRDPRGKAEDVCNCRCTILMLPPEKSLKEI